MDGQRFDNLVRSLARRDSRRGFLAGAAVAVAGLARVRAAGAQGVCPAGQVNRRGLGCVCRSTGRAPVNGGCPCAAGGGCPTGQTCCGGLCVDTQTNPAFCGSCAVACAPSPQEACCAGVCADIQRDEQNCGACAVVCPDGLICGGGGTIPGECCGSALDNAACLTDDDCCFGDPCCGGVCTRTFINDQHCGACFNACADDEQCRGFQGCCGNPGSACTVDEDCCFGCNTGAGQCLDAV